MEHLSLTTCSDLNFYFLTTCRQEIYSPVVIEISGEIRPLRP